MLTRENKEGRSTLGSGKARLGEGPTSDQGHNDK